MVGIQAGQVALPIVGPSEQQTSSSASTTTVRLKCSSEDSLYTELRNEPFERIGDILQTKARRAKLRYDTFKGQRDSASIADIHKFVKELPAFTADFQHIDKHISIAKFITEKINQRVYRECWRFERAILEEEDDNESRTALFDFLGQLAISDVKGVFLNTILRLLSLASLVHSTGIPPASYDQVVQLLLRFFFLPACAAGA